MKQVIIILNGEKPIKCCEIKNIADSTEFLKLQKECDENLLELERQEQEKVHRIEELERKLHCVETELAYNRGEITEKEYNKVCGKQ